MSLELKELLLAEPKLTLAVAESLTCGRVLARIGAVSGASQFLQGGIVAYTLEQKVRHLGVDREAAAACHCVSQDVAEQMAIGACALFEARVGLSTTGFAEPGGDNPRNYPFAWWAIAHDLGDGRSAVVSGMVECPGADRLRAQETVSIAATGALVRYLRQARAGAV